VFTQPTTIYSILAGISFQLRTIEKSGKVRLDDGPKQLPEAERQVSVVRKT